MASFAFRFLMQIASRLRITARSKILDRPLTSVQRLYDRVLHVCKGHLQWIINAETTEEGNVFAEEYTVTGKIKTGNVYGEPWHTKDSILHTAFNLLKAALFLESEADDSFANIVRVWRDRCAEAWLNMLATFDPELNYVWPRQRWLSESEDVSLPISTFRLNDHVWICLALESFKAIYLPLELRHQFSTDKTRRKILQHFFSTSPDDSDKLLAVTKSLTKVRFSFHRSDTVLLYGEDQGLFTGDSALENSWRATLALQNGQNFFPYRHANTTHGKVFALRLLMHRHETSPIDDDTVYRRLTHIVSDYESTGFLSTKYWTIKGNLPREPINLPFLFLSPLANRVSCTSRPSSRVRGSFHLSLPDLSPNSHGCSVQGLQG